MNFRNRPRRGVEINVVPFIDVVFFLLVFFIMVTTLSHQAHLTLNLPQAKTGEQSMQPDALEISITATGAYSVNGKPLVNNRTETLMAAIREVSGNDNTKPLMITADSDAPHHSVVTAMDAAGQLGFVRLSITTRETETEAK